MAIVRQATSDDFEKVYKLLIRLSGNKVSKDQWYSIFNINYTENSFPGFLLEENEEVVGFFGTVFSSRNIQGKTYKFCNCHSWIVDEQFKSYGLSLLNKIHQLKDHIITNFSASTGPYHIMKQLKWQELNNEHSFFFRNLKSKNEVSCKKINRKNLSEIPDTYIRKIASDHLSFPSTVNLISIVNDFSLQIFKTVEYFPSRLSFVKKLIPVKLKLGQLYFVSDHDLFFENFKSSIKSICATNGWTGVIIPNRWLKKYSIASGRKYFGNRPVLYRASANFGADMLDMLYSEVFILDLN